MKKFTKYLYCYVNEKTGERQTIKKILMKGKDVALGCIDELLHLESSILCKLFLRKFDNLPNSISKKFSISMEKGMIKA